MGQEGDSLDRNETSYQDVYKVEYNPVKESIDFLAQSKTVAQNLEWLRKMALAARKGTNELEVAFTDVTMQLQARMGELKAMMG